MANSLVNLYEFLESAFVARSESINSKEVRVIAPHGIPDPEIDVFEIHKCPVCGVEDEFNMDFEKFLCRHCGKASTGDIRKFCESDNVDSMRD